MKKTSLKVLAISALLTLGVVGCNQTNTDSGSSADATSSEAEASVSDSSESSSNADANKAGRVKVDNAKFQSEIVIGDDNAFDLDTCVTVERVSSWSVTSDSSTIEIDGHKIIGVDYGPWKATIIAGKTKRAISGYVVSSDKVSFNTFFSTIGDNYESYSAISGWGMAAKDYYLSLADADSTTQTYTFEGGMTSNDKWYSFSIDADKSLNFDSDSFTVDPGYTYSKESAGFGEVTLDPASITEELEDGVPFYATEKTTDGTEYDVYGYVLSPDGADEEEPDKNISDFLDSIGQSNYWYYMSNNYGATYLLIYYAPAYNQLTMYPCSAKGPIQAITDSDGEQYSAAISLASINEVKVDAVENWLANPTYPAAIDVNNLQTFFDLAIASKKYTLDSYGKWYDPSTKMGVECPKNMHFSDTGDEAFSDFESSTAVNENMVEQKNLSVSSKYGYLDYVSAPGTTDLIFIDTNANNAMKSVTGTYDSTTKKTTYKADDVKTVDSKITDIWETTYTPVIFATDFLEKNDGTTYSLLDLVGFRGVTENKESGSHSYVFNACGDDFDSIALSTYLKGAAGVASNLSGDIAYYNFATMILQGWEDYFTFTFELDDNLNWLEFAIDFSFSSTAHYAWGWKMYNIGEDAVSDEAKALLTPASSGDEDSSSSDSSDSSSEDSSDASSSSAEA